MTEKDRNDVNTAAALAAELGSLRLAEKQIKRRIVEVRSRLYEEVGEGWEYESDGVSVRVSAPSVSCRVVSSDAVPAEFKSLKPDKRLIMKSLKDTGVIVPGTEITQVWNNIKVDLKGDPMGLRIAGDEMSVVSEDAPPTTES